MLWNSDEKIRAGVLKMSLGVNFIVSKNLGSAEISVALGVFLDFLGCGNFFFENFNFLKLCNFMGNLWIFMGSKCIREVSLYFYHLKTFGSENSA